MDIDRLFVYWMCIYLDDWKNKIWKKDKFTYELTISHVLLIDE